MIIELHSAYSKERVQKHLELMYARVKLAALDEVDNAKGDAEIADAVIDERLRNEARARAQASKAELRESVRIAELTIRQLDDEMEKLKVETPQTGQWSLEIDTLREELEQAKSIDQRITEEMERLKVELNAGSRVTLYREAEVPRLELGLAR
jgi:hypothetical protein